MYCSNNPTILIGCLLKCLRKVIKYVYESCKEFPQHFLLEKQFLFLSSFQQLYFMSDIILALINEILMFFMVCGVFQTLNYALSISLERVFRIRTFFCLFDFLTSLGFRVVVVVSFVITFVRLGLRSTINCKKNHNKTTLSFSDIH